LSYPDEPLVVLANETRLAQVFVNLLSNAAQSIPEGDRRSAEIRFTIVRDGPRVQVEVADNGVGIAPEVRERLFTPFFTTKALGDGTGLGLAVCHAIVTRYQGEISVESEPGSGATFRIVLPLRHAP
jgi:signal transduction histidine kinase